MEYRHLRFFLAVADELHFTRAAGRLGVAQPHLSHEIRRLEEELGVQLFARTRRKVEITAAGEAFRAKALAILAATDEAVEAARRAARGETGRLVVGFAGSAGYDVLPAAVRSFRAHWPDVQVLLREIPTLEQLRALRERGIDVALGRPRGDPGPGVSLEVVREEPSMVALPVGHPLLAREVLGLADLAAEPWIVFDRNTGPGLYALLVSACEDAGFSPRVTQEAGEIPTMINLVASGLGVALVPAPVAQLSREGVVYRRLTAGAPPVPLGLLYRTGGVEPVVRRFLEAVRAAAGAAEPEAPRR